MALKFGLIVQCYTDDNQLYFDIAPNHIAADSKRLKVGVDNIYRLLLSNRLKLNLDKMEIMWCMCTKRCGTFPEPSLSVGNVIFATNQFC